MISLHKTLYEVNDTSTKEIHTSTSEITSILCKGDYIVLTHQDNSMLLLVSGMNVGLGRSIGTKPVTMNVIELMTTFAVVLIYDKIVDVRVFIRCDGLISPLNVKDNMFGIDRTVSNGNSPVFIRGNDCFLLSLVYNHMSEEASIHHKKIPNIYNGIVKIDGDHRLDVNRRLTCGEALISEDVIDFSYLHRLILTSNGILKNFRGKVIRSDVEKISFGNIVVCLTSSGIYTITEK